MPGLPARPGAGRRRDSLIFTTNETHMNREPPSSNAANDAPLVCLGQAALCRASQESERADAGALRVEYEICGALDTEALELAVRDVIRRHSQLRAVLSVGDRGVSRVDVDATTRFADSSAALHESATAQGRFEFHAGLRRLSPEHHRLTLKAHRSLVDLRSEEIIERDISCAYHARLAEREPKWAPLAATYDEFIRWNLRVLECMPGEPVSQQSCHARHLRFWNGYLKQPRAGADRPGDQRVDTIPVEIPPALFGALLELANARRMTIDSLLRAAVAASLSFITGSRDVRIATQTHARHEQKFHDVVGAFESTLIFRYGDLRDLDIPTALDRVRDQEVEAWKRPHLPAGYLCRKLFDAPCAALADALVVLRPERKSSLDLLGTVVSTRRESQPVERFPLHLELSERANGGLAPDLAGQLTVCAGSQIDIEGLWAHAITFLKRAIAASVVRPGEKSTRRWSINRLLYRNRHLPPHDPTQVQVARVWEDVLRQFPVGVWDDFFELGATKADYAELVRRLDARFGVRLGPGSMEVSRTVEAIAAAIASQLRKAGSFSLTANPETSRDLFFLHGDFNGGGLYARLLGALICECAAIHLLTPHGMDDAPIPETIEAMAEAHLQTIRSIQPRGPYNIAGHCNGGLIAFEIARRLLQEGEAVEFLGAIHSEYANGSANARHGKASVPGRQAPASGKTPAGKAGRRASALRFEAYAAAMAKFAPQYFAGKLTLFWPRAERFSSEHPVGAWERVAREVELRLVPGDHLTAVTHHVDELASALNECLRGARVGPCMEV